MQLNVVEVIKLVGVFFAFDITILLFDIVPFD